MGFGLSSVNETQEHNLVRELFFFYCFEQIHFISFSLHRDCSFFSLASWWPVGHSASILCTDRNGSRLYDSRYRFHGRCHCQCRPCPSAIHIRLWGVLYVIVLYGMHKQWPCLQYMVLIILQILCIVRIADCWSLFTASTYYQLAVAAQQMAESGQQL